MSSPVVPLDPAVAARIRATMCLDRVLEISPVRIVGKEALCRLAGDLDALREPSKPTVTPSRLAYRLRHACWFAATVICATKIPLGRMDDNLNSGIEATHLPNADAKKAALRKLGQAKHAFGRVIEHLSADVVQAFGSVDECAVNLLRNEINRLETTVEVPLHFRRGRPVLALLIEDLHLLVFTLTGGWQRSRGKADVPEDGFITDWLHEVARAIVPKPVSDNDIGMCIETAIRRVRR